MIGIFAILISAFTFNVNIGVAEGHQQEIPNTFYSITSFDHLKISTSYWARVEVEFPNSGDYVLEGGKPNMQRIAFFDEHGQLLKKGNHLEINVLEDDLSKTYFLYYSFVDEKDKNLLSIALFNYKEFLKQRHKSHNEQAIFQAVLSFPLMIALFFALFNQKRVYLYYALYILSIMFFFGYQYGLVGSVVPFINGIPPMWIWFFSFLITVFYLLFSASFLDLKKHDPFALRLIIIAIYFIIFFFLISLTLYVLGYDVQHSLTYKLPFWIVQLYLVFWFIIRIFGHPSKIKKYYLVGFFIVFIISISGQFLSASQSASNYNYLFQAGLILEVFVLALGLGARVNEIQNAEIKAQKELIDQLKLTEKLQEEYAEQLETKVLERTNNLAKKNKEFELLLKEVHHRVKNNLQMIISLLNMQDRRMQSPKMKGIFVSTKNKIKTLAMIHEHLYQNEDLTSISLENYLKDLCWMIISTLHKGNPIDLRINVDPIQTEIDTGISIGIMVNELVTNSLKYGIAKIENPKLTISVQEKESKLLLIISDNGKGIAETQTVFGLGYTIIQSILDSHNGHMNFNTTNEHFTIEIMLEKY